MLTTRENLQYLYIMDINVHKYNHIFDVYNTGKVYAFRDNKWRNTYNPINQVCNDPDVKEISEEDAMLELI